MKYNKKTKLNSICIVTYIVFVACMVAAMFIPYFDKAVVGGVTKNVSLFQIIPAGFGELFGMDLNLTGEYFLSQTAIFTSTNMINMIYALGIMLMALMTLLSLIMVIPVAVEAATCKKHDLTVKGEITRVTGWAWAMEIISFLSVVYIFFSMSLLYEDGVSFLDSRFSIMLFLLLGLIWLVMTIQTIYYKSACGSGVAKSIMLAVSLLCASFICITPTLRWGAFESLLENWGMGGTLMFVSSEAQSGMSGIEMFLSFLPFGHTYVTVRDAVNVFAMLTVLMVIVNLVMDAAAVSTKSNLAGKTVSLIRYALELAFAAVTAIIISFSDTYTMGIYLYIIIGISFIQLIVSIVRMFINEKVPVTAAEPVPVPVPAPAPVAEPAPAPVAEPAPAPAPVQEGYEGFYEYEEEPVAEPAPVQKKTKRHDVDPFIDTLSESEKAEFYAFFIDKIRGNYYFVPEYVICGENLEFFKEVFIHLGSFLNVLSDQLLGKMNAWLTKVE